MAEKTNTSKRKRKLPFIRSFQDNLLFWQERVTRPVSDYDLRRGSIRTTSCDVEVFKKVYWDKRRHHEATMYEAIAYLVIPKGTRLHIQYYKCRAACAEVTRIEALNGTELPSAMSGYSYSFVYEPGKVMVPTHGFSHRRTECAGGIHFFIDIRNAIGYI